MDKYCGEGSFNKIRKASGEKLDFEELALLEYRETAGEQADIIKEFVIDIKSGKKRKNEIYNITGQGDWEELTKQEAENIINALKIADISNWKTEDNFTVIHGRSWKLELKFLCGKEFELHEYNHWHEKLNILVSSLDKIF